MNQYPTTETTTTETTTTETTTDAEQTTREVPARRPACVFAAAVLHRFRLGELVEVPVVPPYQTLGSTDPSNQLAWKQWAAALDQAADRRAFPWR